MDNDIKQEVNKSGGPKSEAGKAISRYNAVRHRILKQLFNPAECEEAEVIKQHLLEELQPQSLVSSTYTLRVCKALRKFQKQKNLS